MAPVPKIPFVLSRHYVTVAEMLPLLIHSTDCKIKCVLIVQIQINRGLLFFTFTSNDIKSLSNRVEKHKSYSRMEENSRYSEYF